jgi:hypothetical protein
VGHTGAADGFNKGFLNNALLHIEGQLASTLLRSAPTHTVGKAGDVLNLGGLRPGTLLGDGGGAVIAALLDATHLFDFVCVLHNIGLCYVGKCSAPRARAGDTLLPLL